MGVLIPPQNEPTTSGHFIEFRNVSKAFGDHLVLDDISFYVDHGETCVIMGRSGVGKSVTLKIILGFLQPDAGRVLLRARTSPTGARTSWRKFAGASPWFFSRERFLIR